MTARVEWTVDRGVHIARVGDLVLWITELPRYTRVEVLSERWIVWTARLYGHDMETAQRCAEALARALTATTDRAAAREE